MESTKRMPMTTTSLTIKRFSITSTRSFDEVLKALEKGIGRPNLKSLMAQLDAAPSFAEYRDAIHKVVGGADLMEFLRLDLGATLRKDPVAKAYNVVRIIAGNPLIMKRMVEHVPDAGSYAPVTILVYERPTACIFPTI